MKSHNTVPHARIKRAVWDGVVKGIALVMVAIALSACNGRPLEREFNDDEVNDIGSSVTNEVGASTDGMSLSDVITGGGTDPITIAAVTPSASGPCPTFIVPPSVLNPDGSPTDTDKDRVPDDLLTSFDPAQCSRTFFGGSRTRSGQIEVQDPKPTVADGSYQEALTNFTQTTVIQGRTTTETRNGSRSLINAGNTTLTKTHDLTLKLNLPGFIFDLALRNAMQINFTASVPGSISLNRPLPAGTLVVNGSTEWARGLQARKGFSVTTASAVAYDPACQQPLVGGELILTRPSGLKISIQFQPCGTRPVFTQLP
jgi:hypothetical protein